MKKFVYFSLFILVGVLFCIFYNSAGKKDWNENTPLSEFMIGKWKSSKQANDIYGSFLQEYHFKFSDQSKLELCIKSRELFCDEYTYQLISDNTFRVESERDKKGQWEISRDGDNLLICMSTNPIDKDNCIIFTRDDAFWFW